MIKWTVRGCHNLEARIQKIDRIISEICDIIKWLCTSDSKEAFGKLAELMPDLNEVIGQLLTEIPHYRTLGVDLPEDVILAQLQNLAEGMQYKDMVLLMDTLQYEIMQTLQVYKEILEQL